MHNVHCTWSHYFKSPWHGAWTLLEDMEESLIFCHCCWWANIFIGPLCPMSFADFISEDQLKKTHTHLRSAVTADTFWLIILGYNFCLQTSHCQSQVLLDIPQKITYF